jgi:putative DNA primase/helicase
LYGKLANISSDLPGRALQDTGMFKAITGGDAIQAQRKYGQPFSFVSFARLVFPANEFPRGNDPTQAFTERWSVIPFPNSFRGTVEEIGQDTLLARLTDPKELSGVLNRALDAYKGLKDGGRFTESQSTEQALGRLKVANNDPFMEWLAVRTVSEPAAEIPAKDLRADYGRWAKAKQKPELTDAQFGKALKQLRPEVQTKKRGPRGEQEPHYIGIGLKGPFDAAGA